MEVKQITYSSLEEDYNKLLFSIKNDQVDFQFGTVFLQKGTRIPAKGFAKHDRYEVSIIQKGKIEMLHEDGSVKGYLKTGDVVYIKAFEAQAGNVLEDTQIMYTLIK